MCDKLTHTPAKRVLVTGASGFLGQALTRRLRTECGIVTALSRHLPIDAGQRWTQVRSYDGDEALMTGQDCVVHLAARVHVMNELVQDPLAEFRAANVDLTINLARQAARAGVRRFIFISSVKVNGEETAPGCPFSAEAPFLPQDPYGISKMEAEQALAAVAEQTGMEVVIIRPPLVYGSGVRANFGSLLHAVARGLPLPLGAIHNRRSLVALDNLVDLIVTCINHPKAAGQVWMVSDGEDLSTPELIHRMAMAMHRSARLVNVPVRLLKILGKITGRANAVQRLCGNLQVDISKTQAVLGWNPPIGVDEGLRRAAVQWQK